MRRASWDGKRNSNDATSFSWNFFLTTFCCVFATFQVVVEIVCCWKEKIWESLLVFMWRIYLPLLSLSLLRRNPIFDEEEGGCVLSSATMNLDLVVIRIFFYFIFHFRDIFLFSDHEKLLFISLTTQQIYDVNRKSVEMEFALRIYSFGLSLEEFSFSISRLHFVAFACELSAFVLFADIST